MEKIDWQKNYAEGWKIFDEVLNHSGYGKSKVGGPVWVIDVRYDNIAALLPDSSWLPLLKSGNRGCYLWLEMRFYSYIRHYALENVLLLGDDSAEFYGWGSFLEIIKEVCQGGRIYYPSEDKLENKSYKEAKAILSGEIYTHLACKGIGGLPLAYPVLGLSNGSGVGIGDKMYYYLNHCPSALDGEKRVLSVEGIENYLPMLVYDLMESITVNGIKCSYPRVQAQIPKVTWSYGGNKRELNCLALQVADRMWHYSFPLKQQWEVCPQ